MVLSSLVVLALLGLVRASTQLDPVKNFCIRGWHQSVIKNDTLYIDGGVETFTNINSTYDLATSQYGPITEGYNQYLIEVSLHSSFNLSVPGNITERVVNKTTNPSSPTTVPNSLQSAVLFQGAPDDPNIYLYGGSVNWWNMSFPNFQYPQSDEYSLFSYNLDDKSWTAHNVGDEAPWRPAYGLFAEAPELGLGFYYNGELDSGNSNETQGLTSYKKIFLEGMVVLNLTDRTARNISTAGSSGSNPHTRGAMEYIPGIGDMGILVALGGSYKSITDHGSNEMDTFVNMSMIDIFDVASLYSNNKSAPNGAWYQQATTGDPPVDRAQFCAVSIAAPDNSSYNIYVVGGNNQALNEFYDDVYVLSIPSFTWTKVYGEGGWPRYGHTCHRVGNRQLVTVGGIPEWSFNNGCDFETHSVAILDMAAINWTATYTYADDPYTVPLAVAANIGGDGSGGATMTAPSGGYTNLALAQLFNDPKAYVNTTATSSTTPSPTSTPSHHSDVGAIVGGVIGGLAALALLILAVWLIMRQKNKKRQQQKREDDAAAAAAAYMPSEQTSMLQSPNPLASPYSERGHGQTLRTEMSGEEPWGQPELEGTDQRKELPEGGHGATSELPGAGLFSWNVPEKDATQAPAERFELSDPVSEPIRYELPGSEREVPDSAR